MILPASQAATLALLLISLICWGLWANTLKLAGTWRFELYFCDFALGFALLAVVAAFTGGTLSSSELTFQENFLVASYRNVAYVLVAGAIFNAGNMLLTATVSMAGMALAFSVTCGVALTVATIRTLIFDAPTDLRDLVWMPAQIIWANGGEAVALIPTRYPGSEGASDTALRLARRTDWQQQSEDVYFGLGQRAFITDGQEFALLDARRIDLQSAAADPVAVG